MCNAMLQNSALQMAETEDHFSGNGQFCNDELGLSYDCPPIPRLFDTICQIAGSTLTAIKGAF